MRWAARWFRLLLGAFQMGSYRRPNAWLHLLHRPVPQRHLAGGLMLAAAALLLAGVLLPLLAIAGWQEGMTARPLDTRHLWLLLSAWLVSLCGYLAGLFCSLHLDLPAAPLIVWSLALLAVLFGRGLATTETA